MCIGGKGKYGIPASAVPYSENLYTYLRITDITDDGRINKSGLVSVDDKKAGEYLLQPNDIVFARTGGSTGRNYFYDGTDGVLVYAGFLIKFSIDPKRVNPKYVKYYCQSKQYRDWINSFNTGSTRGNINAHTYANMEIPVPDTKQQDLLVATLSALDDKIELNNKLNDNLQRQAFTLFDRLMMDAVNTECQVSEIAYINPKRPLSKNQTARYIDMSQLSTSGAFPSGWEMKTFTGGMRFTNGDTLLARITPCLENGKTAYIDFLEDDEIAFGSTEYIVLTPKEGIPPEYLYCLARYPAFVDYAVKNMNGSSGRQRVSADTIGQFVMPRPSENAMRDFGAIVSALFMKMKSNSLENIKLASLRDILLPRLMSGEIDVSDIRI